MFRLIASLERGVSVNFNPFGVWEPDMKQNVGAILLAIVGIVLGVIGTFTGISAKNQQSEILASVKTLDEKVEASAVAQDSSMKGLWSAYKNDISTVNSDLAAVQQALADMTNKPAKPQQTAAADAGAVVADNAGAVAAPAKPVESQLVNGMYTIQKGDTLGKIASRFKVSKNAIAVANPKTDMMSLPVGKKIKIP